jgi:hypothetical protein
MENFSDDVFMIVNRGETSPFNSGGGGGVSAGIALPKPMMPCSNFLFLATIFIKKVGEIFGPISVKFRSINYI